MSSPSMVHRSGDVLVVRSVVSGNPLFEDKQNEKSTTPPPQTPSTTSTTTVINNDDGDDSQLPQCKIKRNYSCNQCMFFSQNPRSFLYHARDVHFGKFRIHECPHCLYASKHSQKLQRHIKMIHASGKITARTNPKKKPVKKKEPPPPTPQEEINEDTDTNENKLIISEIVEETDAQQQDGVGRCSVCNYACKNHSLLRRHERIVHLKKRLFRCAKCSYVTHVKARFTKHVKYHSMPMIKCNLCDFRTPYKWNLDRHYKNHCGTGAFECCMCNFRADIKQSLTVHEMNHHIPPIAQGIAVSVRRRNMVGASDELEQQDVDDQYNDDDDDDGMDDYDDDIKIGDGIFEPSIILRTDSPPPPEEVTPEVPVKETPIPKQKKKPAAKTMTVRSSNTSRRDLSGYNKQSDFIHPDDIVPRYGQIYVKNLKCKFCSYKAVFDHEIFRHEKRIHGFVRSEQQKDKQTSRPPPNLIPIQNKTSSGVGKKNKETRHVEDETSIDDDDLKEMCKNSCLTSSLKDFASLIGEEEAFKNLQAMEEDSLPKVNNKRLETKKKNTSFFDKLKEKLLVGSGEEFNLVCDVCGYESKCLSESLSHQKRHEDDDKSDVVVTQLSSTRCQYCRQRCKTSSDLVNHLKTCKAFESSLDQQKMEVEEQDGSIDSEEWDGRESHPMENRVFVWNELPDRQDVADDDSVIGTTSSGVDMDVIPGYGTVTNKGSDNTESGTLVNHVDPTSNLSVKKVFKCPHCSFWASTASRFHVHIVGHLNKKPFECSLCLYRSNWRWDITKHIRLKSARDPTHLQAQVNMTDETGRRNYTKYNKFLTMMRVQEPTAESSGTGRRTKHHELTQGTVSESDILPAPPRLTRAPTPGSGNTIPQGLPLRPPPLLKATSQRVTDSGAKKTMWKCKKCSFRHSARNEVLNHVKQHYEKQKEKTDSSKAESTLMKTKEITIELVSNKQEKSEGHRSGDDKKITNSDTQNKADLI